MDCKIKRIVRDFINEYGLRNPCLVRVDFIDEKVEEVLDRPLSLRERGYIGMAMKLEDFDFLVGAQTYWTYGHSPVLKHSGFRRRRSKIDLADKVLVYTILAGTKPQN
jgi:hypothetical protein